MFATSLLLIFLVVVSQINGREIQRREDSLTVMRERCAQNPSASECTSVKLQMEDLLRKCAGMATPVSACQDVKSKYCYIWPRELYCGASVVQTTRQPIIPITEANWNQIPSNPNELKARGDYCVVHQSEQKCKDLLTAIKIRYDDCSKRPTTDYSCQTFKITLCSAFPNFSPCLNSGVAVRKRTTRLERLLRMLRKISTSAASD